LRDSGAHFRNDIVTGGSIGIAIATPADGGRARPPERHAVALHGVDLRSRVVVEVLHRPRSADAVGRRDPDPGPLEHLQQRRRKIAGRLGAGIEDHDHLARRRPQPGVDGGSETARLEAQNAHPLALNALRPGRQLG